MPPARVAAMTLSGPVGPEGPNGDGGVVGVTAEWWWFCGSSPTDGTVAARVSMQRNALMVEQCEAIQKMVGEAPIGNAATS